MFEDVLNSQNPHWDGLVYPDSVPRQVLEYVKQHIDITHVLSFVGVRRAGKSTLMRQTINHLIRDRGVPPRNILFCNLEMPVLNRYRSEVANLDRLYEDYLKLAAPKGRTFVFLDEVQFFPDWQVFVKSRYELGGIKFMVTGSNSRLLSSDFMTLLSGRTLPVEVFPFSFVEFLLARNVTVSDEVSIIRQRLQLQSLCDDYLRTGGFPEAVFLDIPSLRNEVLGMYARTILQQDIVPRFAVKKPADLETLFLYLMTNVSALYTPKRLSAVVGLSDKTIKDYLAYYGDVRLLFALDVFHFSMKQQIRSPRKIYAVDTGLAAAVSFRFSENTGRYLENLVFLELHRRGEEMFYYRTANGLEVDFLCRKDNRPAALIQTVWDMEAEDTRKRELRALAKAMTELKLKEALVVTHEQEGEIAVNGGTVRLVPAWRFLLGRE
jgi:uncharacterized protein